MQDIQHIFFDLDHTLFDFDKNSNLTFKEIFFERNISLNLNDFIVVYNPINLKYWKLYREDKIDKPTLRYNRLKETFDVLNFKASDNLINTIADDYLSKFSNYNYLMDGALDILEYLHPKYKLHIITNGFKNVQFEKMTTSNIVNYFDVIVTSESVGLKKPNPKVFEYALKNANATRENAIMIGDSLEADVLGALNCGMQAIHFNIHEIETSILNEVVKVTALKELKQYF